MPHGDPFLAVIFIALVVWVVTIIIDRKWLARQIVARLFAAFEGAKSHAKLLSVRAANREKIMLKLVTAIMLVAFATPALADYWVVKDPSAQKCSIVEKKPGETPDDAAVGTSFKTQAEAQAEIQRLRNCGRPRE